MACRSCVNLSNNNEQRTVFIKSNSCDDNQLKNEEEEEGNYDSSSIEIVSSKSELLSSQPDTTESITDSCTSGQPVCRVCFEYGDEPLLAPCKCDGSAKYIHERCMLTWFEKTRRRSCEICLSKVNIKSTGCKPMIKWRIPSGTYNFVFYFYIIYAVATFCTSGIAFSVAVTEKCITPTCIALYIACLLSIVSLVYCAGFTIYIKMFWKAALTTNRTWKVQNRVSCRKTDEQIAIHGYDIHGHTPYMDTIYMDNDEDFYLQNRINVATSTEDSTLENSVLIHTPRISELTVVTQQSFKTIPDREDYEVSNEEPLVG